MKRNKCKECTQLLHSPPTFSGALADTAASVASVPNVTRALSVVSVAKFLVF